jgi:hypothetical protein
MSNLIKSTSVYIPKEVSITSRNIYQAHSSEMIKNVEDKNIVVNSIHQAVNRSIADKGVNMDVKDMNYLKISITDDILRDFTTLTLQDISLCFSMGVRGNLGEYYGINVVTLYGWLKKYKQDVIPEAVIEVNRYLPPPKEEETVIDYKKFDLDSLENICSAIQLFITDNVYEFNDFGNIHYNFLNRFDVFNIFSEAEKESIKEDAKQLFLSDIKKKNLTLIARGKKYQLNNIQDLMKKIEYGEKNMETSIDILNEKLLLKKFIMNFKFSGNKLDEFKTELIIKVEQHYGK